MLFRLVDKKGKCLGRKEAIVDSFLKRVAE